MNNFTPWPVPQGWQNPLNEWETVMIASSCSAETIRTRLQHLRTTARILDCAPWEVTEKSLLDYVASRSWKQETRRGYQTSIRLFYDWYSHRFSIHNPAEVLPKVKAASATPRPITETALQTALTNATGAARLVLELAAFAGLRAAEIAQVNLSDLSQDLLGDVLIVHGKGGKERVVPISPELAETIRDKADPQTGWILPGNHNGHLSPHWVSKLAARALPDHYTLHQLRHRFGTRAYQGDRDLIAVQRLLGHSSVATTQRYVEPPSDAMRKAVQAAQQVN